MYCGCFFYVNKDEKEYSLSNFTLENLRIKTDLKGTEYSNVDGISIINVEVIENEKRD